MTTADAIKPSMADISIAMYQGPGGVISRPVMTTQRPVKTVPMAVERLRILFIVDCIFSFVFFYSIYGMFGVYLVKAVVDNLG